MVGSRLQEVKPGYDKGQNTTTSNWRSNRQTQRSKILQQVRSDLEIQQCTNQGRRQIEDHIPHEQRTIRAPSDVFWTMQFTRDISKDDEQHFPRINS